MRKENQLVERDYEPAGQSSEELIAEFSAILGASSPDDPSALLPEGVSIENYELV